MNILVTGATGFIGSHTIIELIGKGYNVVGIDNFFNSKIQVLDRIFRITGSKIKFYEGDLRDEEILDKIFKENKLNGVIHFAGLKAVGESVSEPLSYYYNNLNGTINLLRVMEKYSCKNFVFSSSATVYGKENPIPYKEHFSKSATNPYGYTKLMVEQILEDISVANCDFSSVMLRYFNPIGAHESGLIGEEPKGIPNNLMPYICDVAVGKKDCLSVFGDDYNTVDGTGVRDYVHVMDLARGHVLAIKYCFENKGSTAINLGTGKGTSVLELVKTFEEVSGKEIKIKICDRRAGDIDEFYADTNKALEMLEWKSQYTLEDMCLHSWNFIKNNS